MDLRTIHFIDGLALPNFKSLVNLSQHRDREE